MVTSLGPILLVARISCWKYRFGFAINFLFEFDAMKDNWIILCLIKNVFVKRECPWRQQRIKLVYFSINVYKRSQSRSQSDLLWWNLKGFHYLIMHAKYEVSISYGSKVKTKVKDWDM